MIKYSIWMKVSFMIRLSEERPVKRMLKMMQLVMMESMTKIYMAY